MMKAERLVIDTNVLISAALQSRGTPAQLLDALRRSPATLLFSHETQEELATRLLKGKFDRYVSSAGRLKFLAQLDAVAEYVAITGRPMGCRDRDDDKFLETAVLGLADCLISGDNDLLALHPYHDLPILPPATALTWFFPQTSPQ
jgi:putative PIN family toxin of toxin-antitoxin system